MSSDFFALLQTSINAWSHEHEWSLIPPGAHTSFDCNHERALELLFVTDLLATAERLMDCLRAAELEDDGELPPIF